jgi:hypothetical protein
MAQWGRLSCFTDANGNIADWLVVVETEDADNNLASEIVMLGGPMFPVGDGPLTSDSMVAGDVGLIVNPDGSISAGESNSSGSWTESATPEPSSIVLLMTGLAGVIGVARRKFLRA